MKLDLMSVESVNLSDILIDYMIRTYHKINQYLKKLPQASLKKLNSHFDLTEVEYHP